MSTVSHAGLVDAESIAPSSLQHQQQSKTAITIKVKKLVKWSKEEDRRLTELVVPYLSSNMSIPWSEISRSMHGRSGKKCNQRWHGTLDPTLVKGPFTAEEDALILREYGKLLICC